MCNEIGIYLPWVGTSPWWVGHPSSTCARTRSKFRPWRPCSVHFNFDLFGFTSTPDTPLKKKICGLMCTKLLRLKKGETQWGLTILMSWSNENKSYVRADKTWEARVCMRVFLTLLSWSNENKSYTRVDESWQARVCMRVFLTLLSWSNENKSCTRVVCCPGRTRTRVARELMRVDKLEFVWEFSYLSCPGQTRTRVAWELMRVDKLEFVWEFS